MSQEHYDKVGKLMDFVEQMEPWEYDFVMHMADFEERGDLFSLEQQRSIDRLYEHYLE